MDIAPAEHDATPLPSSVPPVEPPITPHAAVAAASADDERLTSIKESAREQIAAAWQLYVDNLQEQLGRGWRDHLQQVFDERFDEAALRLQQESRTRSTEEVRREIEARLHQERETARGQAAAAEREQLLNRLNQLARRLRKPESPEQWISTVLEAAAPFAERCALLHRQGDHLHGAGAVGWDDQAGQRWRDLSVPLADASAFRTAMESRDPVVAISSPGELSPGVHDLLSAGESEDPSKKSYLFPIEDRQNCVGVLLAESRTVMPDVSALELVSSLAGLTWGLHQASAPSQPQDRRLKPGEAAWWDLSREEQDLHLRAQRFARVHVAEMRLYKSQQVKAGRTSRDLYGALREEINRGREEYHRQFMQSTPTMVDYFHLELVRTLANDDAESLGPEYPGPMV